MSLKKQSEGNNFCIYFHVNPIKQEIFYVGIGNKKRPCDRSGRTEWWKDTVKKYDYEVIIIYENLTWEEACELEIKYIKQIGRRDKGLGTLVNLTDGGDKSAIGYKHTKEWKDNASIFQSTRKRLPHSKETKCKMSLKKLGIKHSVTHKKNMSKPRSETAKKNMKKSEETKLKMRKPRSEETKRNISLGKKNIPWSQARRQAQLNRKNKNEKNGN